jgi:hypothetical protein
MATYSTEIDSPRDREEAFDYLATFSNAREWDPSVTEAEAMSPGQAQVGSVYRLSVRVAGRVVSFDYTVVALERPHRVVLEARHPLMVSTDTIRVDRAETGSRVRYDAVIEPRGVLRLAAPLVGRSFAKMADRAAAGLRSALA